MLKAIRWVLGKIILFFSWLTMPKPLQRDAELQNKIDKECEQLSIYQFHACPFCVKTRRALRRLNLPIALHDAQHNPEDRAFLEQEGGKIQVPCLRIQSSNTSKPDEWLYESGEIIQYLEDRFS